MSPINKIKQFIKTHKPIDWKWAIILILLKDKIVWWITFCVVILSGIVSYPNKVNDEVFVNISIKTSDSLVKPLQNLYNSGYNIGNTLYPNNIIIGKIFIYMCMIIVYMLILGAILIFLYAITYSIIMRKNDVCGKRNFSKVK